MLPDIRIYVLARMEKAQQETSEAHSLYGKEDLPIVLPLGYDPLAILYQVEEFHNFTFTMGALASPEVKTYQVRVFIHVY